jgi:prefoldin subunit 5
MLTAEKIQARLDDLKAQADQLRGNLNAVGGAIQDCEYWLEQLNEPELELIKGGDDYGGHVTDNS